MYFFDALLLQRSARNASSAVMRFCCDGEMRFPNAWLDEKNFSPIGGRDT
jgi:hypothetical protein